MRRELRDARGQELPRFSVVVPTYERPAPLTRCLRALACLDYPSSRFEVIVVDDGGKAPAEGVVTQFDAELDVTCYRQANAGPAAARNAGAARAHGKYIAFTDDDCAPARDWLHRLADRFAETPAGLIGGRTVNGQPENRYSTASQMLISYLSEYYNAVSHRARFLASNNLAVAAERFRAMGGFDTTYTRSAAEDRELCDRWQDHGYPMVYAPEVLVYHAPHLTLRSFWRQHFDYGRGAYRFRTARAQRGRGSVEIEPLRFYLGLLCYPFVHARGLQSFELAALHVLSQVANMTGFTWEWLATLGGGINGWQK
jgi:GT2 family glycosyltransferase